MLLVQMLKVLPAGSTFKILDEYKPVMEANLSNYDKSIIFKNINDDLMYQKLYQTFHVELVDKIDDIWIINIR